MVILLVVAFLGTAAELLLGAGNIFFGCSWAGVVSVFCFASLFFSSCFSVDIHFIYFL